MSEHRIHRIYYERKDQVAFMQFYKMLVTKGFKKENTLTGAIHSLKEGQDAESLALEILEHLAPGKFEYAYCHEYLKDGTTLVCFNDDHRATGHVQIVIKGRISELRPYIDSWNAKSSFSGSAKVFHLTPIEGDFYDAILYAFKEHFGKDGFRVSPYGTYLKQKKGCVNFDFWGVFILVLTQRILQYKHYLRLIVLCIAVNYEYDGCDQGKKVSLVLLQLQCIVNLPNAPPSL